jgi:hypothetical protein
MIIEGIKLFLASLSAADSGENARQPLLGMRSYWLAVLTGAGLLAFFVIFLAAIQFSTPNLVSNDSYFHIKFAQVMREQGLRPPFPWLPLTILNPQDYVDHHFLYHVLLIPFTYGDLRAGAKWAGVIFPALAFVAGWILLRGQRVPYAALWSLGFLAVSEAFLYRLSMTRVQGASLLMLFLILHVILIQQYRWLLPLTFIYVWLYDAFPLIGLIVVLYVVSYWLLERRLKLSPLVYAGLGIGLGLIINPYFPQNFLFIYHHALPKLTDSASGRVGNEWYPYQTWTLVENSAPALGVLVAGAFALGLSQRRMTTNITALFLIAILFGFLLFKSRRFIEYYPAFALLFCAVAWSALLEEWFVSNPWLKKLWPLILTMILLPLLVYNLGAAQESVQEDTNPYERYAAASAWLKANTPPGSLVYQTDWDDFTQLYYYNTHNTYTLGLDPTYMELYNADLYHLWRDINDGGVIPPSRTIADTFGAYYILTDLKHRNFLDEAGVDPGLQEVYRDKYAAIFQVRNSTDTEAKK